MSKLIIFDCDGVVVDSEIIANRISAEMLSDFGYSISTEETIKNFTGLNDSSMRKIILEESGLDIPEEYFAVIQTKTLAAFENELMPLMKNVIKNLDNMQLERCVASSSPRNRVINSLKITNQHFPREHIFTAQQVSKGKPHPDLFLYAAKEMGYDPHSCIVIEDSPAGIETAIAANMHVIGFVGGSHAQYPWYVDRLQSYEIPLVSSEALLLTHIKNLLNAKNKAS